MTCASCGGELPKERKAYCSDSCRRREEARRGAVRMSKARRLAIAAAVAPALRAPRKPRLLTTTDADGNPVRTITDTDLAHAMLRRADIELSTDRADGTRACEACRKLFRSRAANAKRCDACKLGRCSECLVPLGDAGSVRCRACAGKARRLDGVRAPCSRCGAELWPAGRQRRKRCPTCPAAPKECAGCHGPIAGHARKGLCQRCYMQKWQASQPCKDCGVTGPVSSSRLCAPCGKARWVKASEESTARERDKAARS